MLLTQCHWNNPKYIITVTLHERYGASNHRQHDCLLQSLFNKEISKHRIARPLCESTGGLTSQRVSNVEDVSIWWRHDGGGLVGGGGGDFSVKSHEAKMI